MHLAKLTIEGCRRVQSLELRFNSGLNIPVGPNNVGKTAVVDALRALLSTTDDDSLRVDEYDLHESSGGVIVTITDTCTAITLTPALCTDPLIPHPW